MKMDWHAIDKNEAIKKKVAVKVNDDNYGINEFDGNWIIACWIQIHRLEKGGKGLTLC